MKASEIREKYLEFFKSRGHAVIPAAPIVPEGDPTTLFTSSGMQQLVPYLKGEKHPMGTRLVDSQPSFRAEDIEEVGDNRHTTMFEMLGNRSLGDYFKPDQLKWVWEFFTKELKLDPSRLHVTVFEGDEFAPKDTESHDLWHSLGLSEDHIHYYPASKNWWSRAGVPEKMPEGEIGGPDSEVFYDFGAELGLHENSPFAKDECHVNCDCGRYLEIGNSVFMQFVKTGKGLEPLPAQNVDFGGGLERITAAVQNTPDIFAIDLFQPLIKKILNIYGINIIDEEKTYYAKDYPPAPYTAPIIESGKREELQALAVESVRIVADHTRAAIFMISEGIEPSNKLQGYILRRLLRRAMVRMSSLLKIDLRQYLETQKFSILIDSAIFPYVEQYPTLVQSKQIIKQVIDVEQEKFARNMRTAYPAIMKVMNDPNPIISGEVAFDLFQSHGVLSKVLEEVAKRFDKTIDWVSFEKLALEHQHESRTASAGMFKGGLADQGEVTTKYHTATHLLHQALRDVLGDEVTQAGSNINAERLRFDYTYSGKPTSDQLKKIAEIINEKIKADLPVIKTIEDKDKAIESGARAFFREKYPDKVSVYTIGESGKQWYSKELCGGPHVERTGVIGKIEIVKDENLGSGLRRLYARLA